MMEENKTVFNYLGEIFTMYGIIIAIFVVLNLALGDIAKGYTSFFEYGSGSMSMSTMIQLFGFSVIICIARNLFLTDKWIRNMPIFVRIFCLFLSITVVIVAFVIVFGWFPINDISAWIGFILSFAVSSAAGVLISKLKERAENRAMDKALERFKKGEEEN